MKNIILSFIAFSLCILGSCKDASTDPTPTAKNPFPNYKYTFSGKYSNPNNIPIPKDAYIALGWSVSAGSPDYLYFYGDSYIDTASKTFTIGFKDELPVDGLNRNKTGIGGLGVGMAVLVTTPVKLLGKYSDIDFSSSSGNKFYGGLNWSGFIYIGGDSSQITFRSWGKNFKQGFSYAKGAKQPSGGFDYFIPGDSNDMQIVIDTVLENYQYPNWTETNPGKAAVK